MQHLSLLAGLVLVIGAAQAQLDWWQTGVIYQIYPRSYKDSNGDGIGDINGIISKLDYIASLGVAAVWLSPIYKSPMADFGYDISDFRDIDPLFGTLDEFKTLLAEAKSRNLGIIMDMVPNHSSDEHEWFVKSEQKIDPYTDYYTWQPAKGFNASGDPIPPNNWLSVFGGSAWAWSELRQEYYLHQFHRKQPDFNYNNPAIIQEIKDILTYWYDLGIYGFRWDAVTHMFEDPQLLDEPLSGSNVDPNDYNYLRHVYTQNLPETPYTLSLFKEHTDQYSASAGDGLHRVMMLEVWNPIEEVMQYYRNVSDFPFNFRFLTTMNSNSNGRDAENAIRGWVDNIPDNGWPNWVLGNHDISRVGTRLQLTDGAILTTLLLPGTSINYYGEELGMVDTYIPPEEIVDPAGYRDPPRTPMQWDDSQHAGFTSGPKPWLRVNDNYLTVNVAAEEAAQESVLKIFKRLVSLRKEPAIQFGTLHTSVVAYELVLAYAREALSPTDKSYMVVFNWSHDQTHVIDLSPGAFGAFPFEITQPTVEIRTLGSDIPFDNFDPAAFTLKPRSGCVVSFLAVRP
ncbi:alpha-glucosidase-like [Neocloeon triangulifer]|uniref:alpha-glucosidase-like n=1 Tax=Neocloeon triangulifer TaxID=2078957 RepID=UPI00286F236C|nr:alpha-glucosidase-like [Neocloeon triangulifer]